MFPHPTLAGGINDAVLIGSAQATNQSTIALPVGAVAGDIIIAEWHAQNSQTWTDPSGWSVLQTRATFTGAQQLTLAMYWKALSSADITAGTVVANSASSVARTAIAVIRGGTMVTAKGSGADASGGATS